MEVFDFDALSGSLVQGDRGGGGGIEPGGRGDVSQAEANYYYKSKLFVGSPHSVTAPCAGRFTEADDQRPSTLGLNL